MQYLPHFKMETYLPGDKPLAGQTVMAPSAVRYRPVIFGSANVAMNEPRASNAAMRTYKMTKGSIKLARAGHNMGSK